VNSEKKTTGSDPTWGEIIAIALVLPTLGSAAFGSITLTIAFGLLTIAAAILSVSENMRLNKGENE
jgi:hypothetical protein